MRADRARKRGGMAGQTTRFPLFQPQFPPAEGRRSSGRIYGNHPGNEKVSLFIRATKSEVKPNRISAMPLREKSEKEKHPAREEGDFPFSGEYFDLLGCGHRIDEGSDAGRLTANLVSGLEPPRMGRIAKNGHPRRSSCGDHVAGLEAHP